PRGEGPVILLGAGRLAAQKRFDRLLRAFAAAGPSAARLRIAGDGPDRAALAALAAELGVADRVDMIGYTTDMPAQMAAADLFVLSSDYEGLPAVVIEALASDLPVMSTDCFANARELLTGLPGCAAVERSTEALAEALDAWLAAPPAPAELRRFALPYSTANAVASHLAAMDEGQDNHG
ncbi:MAG: glycosyltransferase, partial [Alphaproteobacteria bacterium HGW-Alphaproteobacteria-13]